jgi:hypothetical protein
MKWLLNDISDRLVIFEVDLAMSSAVACEDCSSITPKLVLASFSKRNGE